MSKIDDYRKLQEDCERAFFQYHDWCERGDNAQRDYLLRNWMEEVQRSGGFFLLLEEHLNKMLAKAYQDAQLEAEEFMRKVSP